MNPPDNPPTEQTGDNCLICGKPVPDYEPIMCCGGFECGCMGQPTNPCVCSKECDDALMSGIGGSYEQRRIDAGIAKFQQPTEQTDAMIERSNAQTIEEVAHKWALEEFPTFWPGFRTLKTRLIGALTELSAIHSADKAKLEAEVAELKALAYEPDEDGPSTSTYKDAYHDCFKYAQKLCDDIQSLEQKLATLSRELEEERARPSTF